MNAVAYIRVSTNKEEQELSLENQREFFERYVEQRGDTLLDIYSDKGKSATKMQNRKGLQRLLKEARKGVFQRLYVKDISRLFRNTLDFIVVSRELASLGVQLHLVNMGEGKDIDTFTLNLMAMMAENESQKISERTKFGKKFSKERGIVPNFVFGYDRPDKYTLIPNPEEAIWVKKIFDLYTEEGWGAAKISKLLFESHVKTKKLKDGQPFYNWSQTTVIQILSNPIYTGMVVNGKESTKNIYTNERVKNPKEEWYVTERPEFRIISDEQFKKAQQIKIENGKSFKNGIKKSTKHLFSNLIKCDCCGFSFRRYIRHYSPNTPPKIWWTCSKRSAYGTGRCESEYIRINEDWLIESLNKLFNFIIEDKEAFFNIVESKCNNVIKEYIKNTSQFTTEDIENELSELKKQREKLKTLAIKGLITIDEAEYDMRPINARIEQLNFKLNEADKTKEITQKVKQNVKMFFNNFTTFDITEKLTNTELKRLIKEIRVISQNEIYVYFNICDDIDGLNFPINISEIYDIDNTKKVNAKANTDSKHSAQRYHGSFEKNKSSTCS